MDKWILVKDALPEEEQQVIYFFKDVGVHIGKFTREETTNIFYGKKGWLGNDVTHWMPYRPGPLPKPPEGYSKNVEWELIKE